jgi:hypothetical protein
VKTDDLIDLLAKDSAPAWRFRSVLGVAVAAGIVIAALVFTEVGFRPDISDALRSGRFLFKFVVTVALAITAYSAARALGRPDDHLGRRWLVLAIAPFLLASAVLVELLAMPEDQWMPRLIGHNALHCLTLIPVLSLGPLACILFALRQGAPSKPGLAGAVAGLAASGIAATFYAANCTDDSPLFVMTWYSLAVLIVTAAGYLVGEKLLRW